MKLALAIVVLIVFALSFLADYKWRQWISARRSDRASADPSRPEPPRQIR